MPSQAYTQSLRATLDSVDVRIAIARLDSARMDNSKILNPLKLNCSAGNKQCGHRCISQDKKCTVGERARNLTKRVLGGGKGATQEESIGRLVKKKLIRGAISTGAKAAVLGAAIAASTRSQNPMDKKK